MEVRIKEGNGYVDAEWTIENGVMMVSPKEVKKEKFIPKIGDVITCTNSVLTYTLLVKNISCNRVYSFALVTEDGFLLINDFSDYKNPRPATKEEKQKLFDKLAVKGWKWDSEKRELVKIKWKPKEGEPYFLPHCDVSGFHVRSFEWEDTRVESQYYKKCWIYKAKEECQEFCNRLNEAINQVKP